MNKGRILIVEDEMHLRNILEKLLVDNGCAVDVASTGKAAITKVKKKTYDVIITDLRLPGISGQEMILRIEKMNTNVKFIIISGYQLNAELEAKIKKGVYTFFEKPFVNKEVVAEVNRLMKQTPTTYS